MKKVVFITRHDPTKTGGGAFATRAYLEAINKLYPKQVVLFVANSYEDGILSYESSKIIKVLPRTKVNAILGILTGKLTRFDQVINNWLKSNNNNIDTVVFDGSIIGGSFVNLFKNHQCKLVTIHHNYEVEYHKENKSIETLKGRFLFWIKKLEARAYQHSNLNLFLTKPDLCLFEAKYGANTSIKKVLGCFEFSNNNSKNNTVLESKLTTTIKLVISGSLVAYQTQDGVNWFLDTIYHKLKEKNPNIELIITGRSPSKDLIQKCNNLNVNVIPSPKDIRKIIATANIYVCPTRLGGGLKLRIMDALALGLPCLIQEKSFRGYENIGQSDYINSFVDDKDFFAEFLTILEKIKTAKNVSHQIQALYQKEFSFINGTKRFEGYLKLLNEKNIQFHQYPISL